MAHISSWGSLCGIFKHIRHQIKQNFSWTVKLSWVSTLTYTSTCSYCFIKLLMTIYDCNFIFKLTIELFKATGNCSKRFQEQIFTLIWEKENVLVVCVWGGGGGVGSTSSLLYLIVQVKQSSVLYLFIHLQHSMKYLNLVTRREQGPGLW